MSEKCSICEAKSSIQDYFFDDRYGFVGTFSLLICSRCGHRFLLSDFSPDQLNELYSTYYPRSSFDVEKHQPHERIPGTSSWINGAKSKAFRWVPENVNVLDIGCGFGETLGYHEARGCMAYGVEVDENIRRVADKFGYKVHVGLFEDSIYEPDFFDYITMDQVIEHATDPLSMLRGVARILKPGGITILSTPNANGWGAKIFGRRWINWHAPYHIQFFSRHSLHLAAEQAGLLVAEVNTITNSEWLYYQWLHLLWYPRPGQASHFWAPHLNGGKMSLFKKIILKFLRLAHSVKINHFLTRFFDSLGLGDNFIIVLKKK